MLLLAALTLAIGGCSLTFESERLSLRHDAEADEVRVLYFYDGIRGRPGADAQSGLESLVERGGLAMMLIHPGLSAMQDSDSLDEVEQQLADHAAAHGELRTVGHYRGINGEIGLALHARIGRATQWMELMNAWIDARVLENDLEDWPRTARRRAEAARQAHTWFTLEDSALVLRIPIDAREWPRLKQAWLADADEGTLRAVTELVTGYEETDDMVTVRLGGRGEALTVYQNHDGRPGDWHVVDEDGDRVEGKRVDEMVVDVAPGNVNELVVAAGPGGERAEDEAVRDVLRWGPVEQYAAAVLAEMDAGRLGEREAVQLLTRWAQTEGERRGVLLPADDVLLPPDEIAGGDEGDRKLRMIFDAWRSWVRQTRLREDPGSE